MQIPITNQSIRAWEKESIPYDLFWIWLEETKKPFQKIINQWIDFRLTGFLTKVLYKDSLERPIFVPLTQSDRIIYVLMSKHVSITGTEVSQRFLADTIVKFQKLKVEKVLVCPESAKPIFFEGISRSNLTPKVSFDMAI